MGEIWWERGVFGKWGTKKEILVLHIELLVAYFFCAYHIDNDNNNEK